MKKKRKNPLNIDIHDLHEEARKQCAAYKRAADEHANALLRKDTAESAKDLKFAQLQLRINKKPRAFGFKDKHPTVDLAKAAATAHPEYQEAVAEFNQAKHDAQTLKGLVDAYSQRKSMIEKEIELWFGSYFASPKVVKDRRRRE